MKKKQSKTFGIYANYLPALDRVYAHCSNIRTLAGLLEACFEENMEASLVRNAGGMIRVELDGMRELLGHFEPMKTTKGERL